MGSRLKTICFVTTGDIAAIATAKRALGLANPLSDLGWKVYIIMEDTKENRHRVSMECDERVNVFYFSCLSAIDEIHEKNKILNEIKPRYIYLCAFVFRNIVFCKYKCIKIVEHSELLSSILNRKRVRKFFELFLEYSSIIYADGIVNASNYLQKIYERRKDRILFKRKMPLLYLPYAYSSELMQIKSQIKNIPYDCENKKVFIYLGTVTRNYGIFTIIEAAKMLIEERTDFCIIVLGCGRDYDKAVETVKKCGLTGFVYMHGFVEEELIPCYFSTASAFISPMNDTIQDWARCPSKLYMYLPYKKPIITCRIGEPLSVFGENGLYYSPNDSLSLKERMLDVIKEKVVCSSVNPLLHTWEIRAKIFNEWIGKMY